MSSREEWAARLLSALGAPVSRPSVAFVVAWMSKEGMRNIRYNNPLATTQSGYGGVPIPGQIAGVKMYPTADQGLAATLHVITRGSFSSNYRPVFDHLARGDLDNAAAQLQRSGWCGGPRAPCPGYGASVLSIARSMLADEAEYNRRAREQIGGAFGAGAPTAVPASTGFQMVPPNEILEDVPGNPQTPGVGGLLGWTDALGKLLSNLVSLEWWRRVGVFALGALLAAGGGLLVFRELAPTAYGSTIGKARSAATLAATKGA